MKTQYQRAAPSHVLAVIAALNFTPPKGAVCIVVTIIPAPGSFYCWLDGV